jgi:uncharacterized protein
MSDMIASRHAERERLIEVARVYARALSERIPVRAVVLAGSVARGDFNVWSDVDVLVVADDLPERLPDRLALLAADAPRGSARQPAGARRGRTRHPARR